MSLPPFNKMQNRAIDFALDREGSAWFMPPGMGKTRAWLEYIKHTPGRTLVLAPKLVCMNTWPREYRKWDYARHYGLEMLTTSAHRGNLTTRPHLLPQVCTLNYEMIPWLVEQTKGMRKFPFTSVIYDELSKMKNPESKRFRALDDILHRFKYRNGGTGTPVGAHLKDLFGEMYVCDMGESLGKDYDRFQRRYFHYCEYTRRLDPYDSAEAEIVEKIAPNAVSFDINDLDMPELAYIPTWMDLPSDVRTHYERMHTDSVVEDLDLSAVNAAVRSGKLRQIVSGGFIDDYKERRYLHDAKAARLKEIVDELQGEPVMIFFEFLSDYESICRVLGQTVPALYGRTRTREANQIVKMWNAGRLPFLALHPRSAAYGLNLQDSGHVLVWYTVPWSFEMLNQGIARLWRQGQRNKVLCYFLLVEDTVDATVYERAKGREATHNRLMQGLL